jgi:hypothetical protein
MRFFTGGFAAFAFFGLWYCALWNVCVLNAMPEFVPAFLEFLVSQPVMLWVVWVVVQVVIMRKSRV